MYNRHIFVSGLINVETVLNIESFPIEYSPVNYTFNRISSSVSGVGYNISRSLSTLGNKVTLLSFLGNDDRGKFISSKFKSENSESNMYKLDTSLISYSMDETPCSVILNDRDGNRSIYTDLKDIQKLSLKNFDPDKKENIEKKISEADLAVLCNINFSRDLIENVKKHSISMATDLHIINSIDDEYNREFLENAEILFISDAGFDCSAEEWAFRIMDRYPCRILVIGMGAKGALLSFRGIETGDIGEVSNGKIISEKKDIGTPNGDEVSSYHLRSNIIQKVKNTSGAGDALF